MNWSKTTCVDFQEPFLTWPEEESKTLGLVKNNWLACQLIRNHRNRPINSPPNGIRNGQQDVVCRQTCPKWGEPLIRQWVPQWLVDQWKAQWTHVNSTECYHWERHRVEVTYALTANCDVITILRINKICNVALMSGIFSWFLIELV